MHLQRDAALSSQKMDFLVINLPDRQKVTLSKTVFCYRLGKYMISLGHIDRKNRFSLGRVRAGPSESPLVPVFFIFSIFLSLSFNRHFTHSDRSFKPTDPSM